MASKRKPVKDQAVVITGASSGIGLATAELFAERGARVVLAARSEATLGEVADRLSRQDGHALVVRCDVTDPADVSRLAAVADETFGRIDTWVNNAGLGLYGRLDETPEADARKLFDVNFWGVVHGCRAALPYLKKQGGALINVGSEVSEAAAPLLGIYVASKHAVKGYTDCLRVEVERIDRLPVSVTLIQPGATDTPFPQHARNLTDREPKLPNPQDDPRHVAEAILAASQSPTREVKVSVSASLNVTPAKFAGRVADVFTGARTPDMLSDRPAKSPAGALDRASEITVGAGRTHGTHEK